jgi:hypothetical protein
VRKAIFDSCGKIETLLDLSWLRNIYLNFLW